MIASNQSPIIVWFRNDLRLHDQEPLARAVASRRPVVPVAIIDPRLFREASPGGPPKTGPYRAKFMLESIADLRKSLQAIGSDLVVRVGHPELVLPALSAEVGAARVHATKEVTSEEITEESAVNAALIARGVALDLYWGATLIHRDDLPYTSIQELPDVYTQFRRAVEKRWLVRPLFPPPTKLNPLPPGLNPGALPSLEDIGSVPVRAEPRAVLPFIGGETAARNRVEEYLWQTHGIHSYKETRNGLLGPNYSGKFSPWLANGTLSPRKIYTEVRRYEAKHGANDSTNWMIVELLWRDYFRFVALKHGDRLFHKAGLRGRPLSSNRDIHLYTAWARGETGYPFVDANMLELAQTGWMSNRGRQNVASFLVKDLGVDWRLGAQHFESVLIDYDPCSNYGNWNYVAGVGNDPREDRYFNVIKQAHQYDPKGDYVRTWIPQLANIPGAAIHEPWHAAPALRSEYPERKYGMRGTAG